MEYQFPLMAINVKGETRIFNDVENFRKFAFDRVHGGVGAYWLETYRNYGSERLIRVHEETTLSWNPHAVKNQWIVRDNRGRPVDKQDFYVPYVWPHGNRWTKERQQAAENDLPIPGTGKRRWHRKSASVKGRNGAHNQRKGIKLYEDAVIQRGDLSDL